MKYAVLHTGRSGIRASCCTGDGTWHRMALLRLPDRVKTVRYIAHQKRWISIGPEKYGCVAVSVDAVGEWQPRRVREAGCVRHGEVEKHRIRCRSAPVSSDMTRGEGYAYVWTIECVLVVALIIGRVGIGAHCPVTAVAIEAGEIPVGVLTGERHRSGRQFCGVHVATEVCGRCRALAEFADERPSAAITRHIAVNLEGLRAASRLD